ncbi:site-specific integrase [Actinoplanes sp. TBRC 11911]|uniref:tyrosine-type recombinase/integrase n=1 Tax=Actinoplanes sp. TBRC 11911 TaxID=2729386 RepID=UPI00145CBB87|nr:site-specific integrase [Actinoplanes sp. TBRC 11911]NMO53445.1 site-specific integrase [Actinoplanes sp. TBRC 11911]
MAYIEETGTSAETEPTATPLLRDWIERWITLKIDVSPGTHAEYARMLRHRAAIDLGDLRVGDITRHDHLDPWKASLAQQLRPASVRKLWTVLSQVMRDAVPRYRPDNPMRRPEGNRSNGLPRITAWQACLLDREEADILIAHCPAPIKPLVLAALGTGMRLGELLGLRAGNVSPEMPVPAIRVEQTLSRSGTFGPVKTPRSRRTILLAPHTARLFAAVVADKRHGELVFTAPDGGPWDAGNLRQRYWRTAVIAAQTCRVHPPQASADTAAGPRAVSDCRCSTRLFSAPRFHDLRHSHVAYLIAAGWDFYMIQLRLGHASIKTTFDIYGHLLPHGERDRLQALDEQLPADPTAAHGAV